MGKRSQLQQSLHLYVWGRHPEDSALLVGCYHLPLCGVGLPHGWEGGPVPPVAVPLSADARDPLHGAVTAVVPVPIHHGEASSPSVTAPSPPDYHNKMWTMFSDSTASLRTLIIGHQNHIMFSRTCKGFCEMDWTKGLGSMLNLLQKKKKSLKLSLKPDYVKLAVKVNPLPRFVLLSVLQNSLYSLWKGLIFLILFKMDLVLICPRPCG